MMSSKDVESTHLTNETGELNHRTGTLLRDLGQLLVGGLRCLFVLLVAQLFVLLLVVTVNVNVD